MSEVQKRFPHTNNFKLEVQHKEPQNAGDKHEIRIMIKIGQIPLVDTKASYGTKDIKQLAGCQKESEMQQARAARASAGQNASPGQNQKQDAEITAPRPK